MWRNSAGGASGSGKVVAALLEPELNDDPVTPAMPSNMAEPSGPSASSASVIAGAADKGTVEDKLEAAAAADDASCALDPIDEYCPCGSELVELYERAGAWAWATGGRAVLASAVLARTVPARAVAASAGRTTFSRSLHRVVIMNVLYPAAVTA